MVVCVYMSTYVHKYKTQGCFKWCSDLLSDLFCVFHSKIFDLRLWMPEHYLKLSNCIYDYSIMVVTFVLYHSFSHPPSLIALMLIETSSWIMLNVCCRGTFGSPHIWKSSREWVAAVWIRWLFIENVGKWHQNGISHEKGRAGNRFGRRGWDMFGVAMTLWVIGEEKRGSGCWIARTLDCLFNTIYFQVWFSQEKSKQVI